MFGTLLVILVVVYLTRKCIVNQKYKEFSGPNPYLSLPLVGHGYLLGSDTAAKFMELRKEYGDIFRFDLGDVPTLVLTTYDLMKEAFQKDVFSGRTFNEVPTFNAVYPRGHDGRRFSIKKYQTAPRWHASFAGNPIRGIVHSEGQIWMDHRKYMLKTLSNLGMGNRDVLEEIIEEEAAQFASLIKKKKGHILTSRVNLAL